MNPFPAHPEPDMEGFAALLRGQRTPDRVRLVELLIDRPILRTLGTQYLGLAWEEPDGTLAGEKAYWRFAAQVYARLGYDCLWVWGRPVFPVRPRVAQSTATQWAETGRGPITSWEEFEAYPWPKFTDEDLSLYADVAATLPDGMGMLVANGDGFLEVASDLLIGYEQMCYLLEDDPALVAAVLDKAGSIIHSAVTRMLELPRVSGVFLGDDMGFGSSTLFAPDFLRASVLPWHKRLAEEAHRRGLLYLLHSCGNLESIMDDLIDDVKIDGKHSYQEQGYPVTEYKRRYGERVALLGGVDVDCLCRLPEPELRAYVRRVLDCCMPGGRYALGSGNSIAHYVPVENYLIMLDEARRWRAGEGSR